MHMQDNTPLPLGWGAPPDRAEPASVTDEYADTVASYQAAQRGLQRQLDTAVRAARQTRLIP